MGFMEDKTHRAFALEDTEKIRDAYLNWRKQTSDYFDEKGFSKAATLADIEKHNFTLSPGRYVGILDEVDDGIPYEEKIAVLTEKLTAQIDKEEVLNSKIQTQLSKIGVNLNLEPKA